MTAMCPKKLKKIKKYKFTFLSIVILFFLLILLSMFFDLIPRSLEAKLYLKTLKRENAIFCNDAIKDRCNSIVSFSLMVADDDFKRARGLMYVKSLDENEGMIFKYDKEQELIFWMKNTYISLDIVFLDKKFNIIGIIENMLPEGNNKNVPDEKLPRYKVAGKAKYAIELPASFVKKYNIKVGGRVNVE